MRKLLGRAHDTVLLETVLLELELLEGAVEAEQAEPASTVVTSMRGFTLALALVLSEKASSCEREVTETA